MSSSYCPFCLEPDTGLSVCPYCGWYKDRASTDVLYLRPGTVVKSPYQVAQVLGHGGFGITYLGFDANLQIKVAIKEYLPREFANRNPVSGRVVPLSDRENEPFQAGLDRFLDEARILAKFQQHPGIVSVLSFFPAFGTGYMVMEYVEGETLKHYIQQRGCLNWNQTLDIFVHIMDALRAVHNAGLLHRDIAPDNIYLCNDGRIKLLDFGAAQSNGKGVDLSAPSSTVILKPGFAPVEQYGDVRDQGPWSDVYSVAASMYFCLAGQAPPDAQDRIARDLLRPPSAFGVTMPAEAEQILLQALTLDSLQRPQSMEALQDALLTVKLPAVAALSRSMSKVAKEKEAALSLEANGRVLVDVFKRHPLIIIMVFAFLIVVVQMCQREQNGDVSMMLKKQAGNELGTSSGNFEQAEENDELAWRREQARQAAEELKQQQAAAMKRFEERQQLETSPAASQSHQDDQRHLEHLRSLCAEWGATMDCPDIQ